MFSLLFLLFATWSGHAARVSINTVNGNVSVVRSPDDESHVDARGINVDAVEHTEVEKTPRELVVCEIYRSSVSPGARCPGSGAMLGIPERPQRVDFDASVSSGVEMRVTTVNGNITAETSSAAQLASVNGAIALKITAARWSESTIIESTNGNVTLDLPENADVTIEAESISSPFRGSDQYKIRLVRGRGRSRLRLHSTSGAVVIREGGEVIAQAGR
jgi:hypothetical protein